MSREDRRFRGEKDTAEKSILFLFTLALLLGALPTPPRWAQASTRGLVVAGKHIDIQSLGRSLLLAFFGSVAVSGCLALVLRPAC